MFKSCRYTLLSAVFTQPISAQAFGPHDRLAWLKVVEAHWVRVRKGWDHGKHDIMGADRD